MMGWFFNGNEKMKLGILADIHEDVESLDVALAKLRRERVDHIVVLGDLLETGRRADEVVSRSMMTRRAF